MILRAGTSQFRVRAVDLSVNHKSCTYDINNGVSLKFYNTAMSFKEMYIFISKVFDILVLKKGYLDLRKCKKQDAKINSIMRNFRICTLNQIFLR